MITFVRLGLLCLCLISFFRHADAQKLSFGGFSGTNFSNIHGNITSDKWLSKPGATTGIMIEYQFNRPFALQSGLEFTSNYYERKSYEYEDTGIIPLVNFTSSLIYTPVTEPDHWDFSWLRFPLQIRYDTPTRLQVGLCGGIFYSLLLNDDLSKKEREEAKDEGRTAYPPTSDWGYLFSSDLSYPLNEHIRFFVSGRISTGRKVIIEHQHGRGGAKEVLFGLKYSPLKDQTRRHAYAGSLFTDNDPSKMYLKPHAGIAFSWNADDKKSGNYGSIAGASPGLIIGYRLDRTVSIESGVRFIRKGYTLSDSSMYNYRYAVRPDRQVNAVDTKILLDYLTVPVNLNFSAGERFSWYLDLGAYAGFLVNAGCRGTVIRTHSGPYDYRVEKLTVNDGMEGYFKSFDWGYLTGTGIRFPLAGSLKLDIELTYSGSMKELLEKPQSTSVASEEDLSVQNGSIALQVGLQIPIPHSF